MTAIIAKLENKQEELVNNMPESCKGYILPLRDKVSKLLGGEVTVGPKEHEELEVTYRGAFSELLGLVNDIKISDGTLKRYFIGF